ncbi:helix-turn-helix transcriptional regulator [Citrifermentans pelophilum]|uniref:helix-turn-helix transcriptional regulator n=1 Tax=Geoanaerobacter pelophilus TaxID=60036 RepID=UPI000A268ACF
MARKTTKKKNSGGRHRSPVDHFGAPPVPMDVLVSEGSFAPSKPESLPSVPESAPAPLALAPLLLTTEQACALLGISRAHFFRLKKSGLVPGCVNLGGLVRYRREDLESWVRQLQPSP